MYFMATFKIPVVKLELATRGVKKIIKSNIIIIPGNSTV